MKAILVEKLLALVLTLGVVCYLPWQSVVLLYIVFGQGHFLLAYLYQYKAGKMGTAYITTALSSLFLICVTYYLWPHERTLVAITTIYFLLHMLFDEMYLLRLPMDLGSSPLNLGRLMEMCPIFFLYSARVVEALFSRFSKGDTSPGQVAIWLSWGSMLLLGLLVATKRYRPDKRSLYFLGGSAFLFWACHTGWLYTVPAGKLTGFVIIYHYLCWYFHYFLQLKESSTRAIYIRRVIAVNGLVLATFGIWGQESVGKLFFQPDLFYIWTLLHLITSTRINDLKGAFSLPS